MLKSLANAVRNFMSPPQVERKSESDESRKRRKVMAAAEAHANQSGDFYSETCVGKADDPSSLLVRVFSAYDKRQDGKLDW